MAENARRSCQDDALTLSREVELLCEEVLRLYAQQEDDSYSISIEWLESIGFQASSDKCIALESSDHVLLLSNWGFEWTVCNGRPKATTRGEIRALCKSLGIELMESAK